MKHWKKYKIDWLSGREEILIVPAKADGSLTKKGAELFKKYQHFPTVKKVSFLKQSMED